MKTYTYEEVKAILCEGCRAGCAVRESSDHIGPYHEINGRRIRCDAWHWRNCQPTKQEQPEEPEVRQSCHNCRFFSSLYECHRHAPGSNGEWPNLANMFHTWCGDWEAKKDKVGE